MGTTSFWTLPPPLLLHSKTKILKLESQTCALKKQHRFASAYKRFFLIIKRIYERFKLYNFILNVNYIYDFFN